MVITKENLIKEVEKDMSNKDYSSYKALRNAYFYLYRHLNNDKMKFIYTNYNKKRVKKNKNLKKSNSPTLNKSSLDIFPKTS